MPPRSVDGVTLLSTVILTVWSLFTFVAPWSWGLPIVTRLAGPDDLEHPPIALTFDDGPSEVTAGILDTLSEHGVQATFFVLTDRLHEQGALVRRMAAEGHAVGVHGTRHRSQVLTNRSGLTREIQAACRVLLIAAPELGQVCWYRPPYGFKTTAMASVALRQSLRLVLWSVDSGDYRSVSEHQIASAVLRNAHPGAIVLLHDASANVATARALPSIILGLRARGYALSSLADGCVED